MRIVRLPFGKDPLIQLGIQGKEKKDHRYRKDVLPQGEESLRVLRCCCTRACVWTSDDEATPGSTSFTTTDFSEACPDMAYAALRETTSQGVK